MRKLSLNKKTGFCVKDVYTPINIRDGRGILFYSTEALVPKTKVFNMPIGDYFIDSGIFSAINEPREYPLAPLPVPQRRKKFPGNFKVIWAENPHKCSIYWDEHEIVFDKSFEEKPMPQVFFILYHEFGHSLYGSEKYADLYSSNMMKIKGYNPSQIAIAQMLSLSSDQIKRKEFVIDKLINTLD